MNHLQTGAKYLATARLNHRRLAELPSEARPQTIAEAYQCQDVFAACFLEMHGGQIIGYKIACTNKIAQDLLHTGPFHGKLFSASSFDSPAKIRTDDFFMRVMEAEFAFKMASDLPPRAEPFTRDEVAGAVEGVLPGIEVVDSRFNEWTTVGAESLIADNACHGAWVKGKLITNWRRLDLGGPVHLSVNGKVVQSGSGAAVLGHPLNALHWLAENLRERGEGLKAGHYITTGVTTDIYLAQRGDRVSADFGQTGTVELTFD
ncbi:MAG: fumarylacetoacetate hydrolase family protein [Bryobacterales bacterium]|nr:fumarylacetoacetate hydrolase family protein [Bryobacterales bacterium]